MWISETDGRLLRLDPRLHGIRKIPVCKNALAVAFGDYLAQLAGGIEFGQYAAMVSAEMTKAGYIPAAPGAAADFTVKLGYGIDEGKERTVVYDDPFYDPFWGYGRFGFGPGYYRPYIVRTPRGARYVYGWHDPFLFGPGFCVAIGNGIILGALMWKSGLVPRNLALLARLAAENKTFN
mgnify:CR=1 FL=1